MELSDITHDTVLFADIPGLGRAAIEAGVDFFRVRFGDRHLNSTGPTDVPPVVLFGKSYRDEVTVSADGATVDVSRFASFTPAARRRLVELLTAWAPTWTSTPEAIALLRATVAYHNRIHVDTVKREIDQARNHLAQLEAIADQLRSADPGEYVNTYSTTHRLVSND